MKSKIKSALISLALLFSGLLLVPATASAALVVCGGNENVSSIQAFNQKSSGACHLSDIFILIARLVNYLIGAAGLFAVGMIVWSGFRMVTSFGNEKVFSEAKKHLTNAVIGFILVLVAFLIVNTLFTVFAPGTPYGIQFNQNLFQ